MASYARLPVSRMSFSPFLVLTYSPNSAERRKDLVVTPETYQRIFSILRQLPDSAEHLIVQLGIPIAYPRMNLAERIIHSDGIVAKITRSGHFPGLVNKYNKDMELLDDLSDHWTAKDHKVRYKYLLKFRNSRLRITV